MQQALYECNSHECTAVQHCRVHIYLDAQAWRCATALPRLSIFDDATKQHIVQLCNSMCSGYRLDMLATIYKKLLERLYRARRKREASCAVERNADLGLHQ